MKVILTHLKPDIWQYKVAKNLKKRGIKVISISLLSFNKKFHSAFDKVISLNTPNLKPMTLLLRFIKNPSLFFNFFYQLFFIKADLAVCQGAPHYLTAIFLRIFKKRFPRIYFPYDLNYTRFKKPEDYELSRELWGERYSLRNCDGIIVKSSEKELELLPKFINIKNKPALLFPVYPLKEWFCPSNPEHKLSYKTGEIHIVYTGSVTDDQYKYAHSFFPLFREILSQRIHLHIYCACDQITKKQVFKITDGREELEKFIHIHPPTSPEKLPKEISLYDFGYYYGYYNDISIKDSIKYSAASGKIASYLEAGIPSIVYKENEAVSKLLIKNKIGLALDSLKDLRKKIKRIDYSKYIKNIQRFREEYSVNNNIDKLIDFFNLLTKNHNSF